MRHRVAIIGIASLLAIAPIAVSAADTAGRGRHRAASDKRRGVLPKRPLITPRLIPMPAERLEQLREFNFRHYGIRRALMRHPNVIVEHWTQSHEMQPAIDYWADWQNPAEGEFPKSCAHFIIDKDGRIYQTVSLRYLCRQGLGVGYTSIGIEHVGVTDQEVIFNIRQMRASLRLTRWLQARFGIPTRNVIGHAEVRRSPYFRDLAPGLPMHPDMTHRTMRLYRLILRVGEARR